MPFPFARYNEVKNRYCIVYKGHHEIFINQMLLVRPLIENKFPGLEIHLCCEDRLFHVLHGNPNVVKSSEFQKRNYGFYKELRFNTQISPVEELLIESGIEPDNELKKHLVCINTNKEKEPISSSLKRK